jgi:hypothetical protein
MLSLSCKNAKGLWHKKGVTCINIHLDAGRFDCGYLAARTMIGGHTFDSEDLQRTKKKCRALKLF